MTSLTELKGEAAHKEADRRIMEATKPQKGGGELLGKFREIAKKRKAGAGAETPAVTQ